MQKYRVMIRGENFITEVEGVRQRLGFYTNLFVEAFTPVDAELRALELLREDKDFLGLQLNTADDPVKLETEQIDEKESFDEFRVPRDAFVFYPLDSDE